MRGSNAVMRGTAQAVYPYVTLDATGTLIRPRASLGATYADHWQRATLAPLTAPQLAAVERHVDEQFPSAFHRQSLAVPNFGASIDTDRTAHSGGGAVSVSDTASPWWTRLILDVMPPAVVEAQSQDVHDAFTTALYAYYATGQGWTTFPDVHATLEALQQRGVRMAVISNFDERLPRILADLELTPFFSLVTTSWSHGAMKPAPSIFQDTFLALMKSDGVDEGAVREKMARGDTGDLFANTLHVGDHEKRDYAGARAVGAQARLLRRNHNTTSWAHDQTSTVPVRDVVDTLLAVVV